MCIVAVAHLVSSRYPLIVAANRDERHARPSLAADWWAGLGSLLAGKDLEAGGSWLGIGGSGRFAAVTNIFEGATATAAASATATANATATATARAARSRGELVTGFLTGSARPSDYAAAVAAAGADYGPFNLVTVAGREAEFVSNRNASATLDPGIHCFSNNRPGIAWAKVDRLAAAIQTATGRDDLHAFLQETLSGPAARGPVERAADSLFVAGDAFGTRCTTVLTVDHAGQAVFVEQRFGPGGVAAGRTEHRFELTTD